MSAILNGAMNTAMSFAQFTEVLRRSMRGLPASNDGLTDAEAAPSVEGKGPDEGAVMRLVKGLNGQIKRGLPLPPSALPSILDAVLHANSEGIDDRKLLLEHILAFLSRMPPGSMQDYIQDSVIALFYDALPHPPVDFLATMAVEVKIPTVIAGVQVGPGGVGVSDGGIGRTGIVAGGKPGPVPEPSFIEAPSSIRQVYVAPNNQLPTPTTSGFVNGSRSAEAAVPTYGSDQSNAPPVPRMAYSTQFRTPSGAQNNPHLPLLGAAGTAYARSVCPQHPMPHASLPDPGMVFDLLMRRTPPPEAANPSSPNYDPKVAAEFRGQGHGQPHPSGLSSLLFAFGDVIIHSLFRTSSKDSSVNLTSSYLDLSPLYGVDETEMQGVRRFDGTGRIWEDVWADPRIAMMPPAVGAVLVVFARNHNYVSLRLLEINEYHSYTDPALTPPPKSNSVQAKDLFPTLNEDKLLKQDDDIFNRARLINCAFFMNVILGDYLSGILGTFREASEWYLNPLEEIRKGGKTTVNRAEGNCVSAEFNLLYRWHATITPKDEQWLEAAIQKVLPNAPSIQQMQSGSVEPNERDFIIAATNVAKAQGIDPKSWSFGGLARTTEGGFADHDLARILHEATSTIACAYGARGIPPVMKAVEIMSIKQARKWGVCTMNEFRKFVGLKQYESFEEWNPTGDIADTARQLYQHIDNLELYPGLMCEESKQPGDGAGLCPGYTISRAILADAVCLTRGDRFLTTDLTPYALTAWGYQDCARDVKNGSMGGMFSKLLFRTVPDYYPEGSVYAHFPFITPGEMKKWLTKMNLAAQYNFTELPDNPIPPVVPINTAKGVGSVLGDVATFRTVYSGAMKAITDNQGFFLSFDGEPRQLLSRRMVGDTLYRDNAMTQYSEFYRSKGRYLLREKSYSLGGKRRAVNIVRDVINVLPVHWVCEEIAGLPLKSTEAPAGIYTEREIYDKLTGIFAFIFLNNNPGRGWELRKKAHEYSEELLPYIKDRLYKVSGTRSLLSFQGIKDTIKDTLLHAATGELDHSDAFYKALLANNKAGLTIDQLAYNVLGLIVAIVAQFSQAATNVLDFYLDETRKDYLVEIEHLAVEHTEKANAKLIGYVREALRLNPITSGIYRKATADATVHESNGTNVEVHKGDRLFLSIGNASKDPKAFPNPEIINPDRPKEEYYSFGRSEYTCFEEIFTESMIPSTLRAIFSYRNVERGPGYSGQINKFRNDIFGTENYGHISVNGTITPFPASLLITYDE